MLIAKIFKVIKVPISNFTRWVLCQCYVFSYKYEVGNGNEFLFNISLKKGAFSARKTGLIWLMTNYIIKQLIFKLIK